MLGLVDQDRLSKHVSAKHTQLAHHRRFGNSVDSSNAGFSFAIQTDGPGPVNATVDPSRPGPSRVQLLARQTGKYILKLVSNETQEVLSGCQIQVCLSPSWPHSRYVIFYCCALHAVLADVSACH